MNELVESPFTATHPNHETAGSRQLQARENTEVMAMAMMAKRFPRDQIVACDRIRNAFTRVSLAEKAQYQYSRGGTDILGPSIRAAEAIGQQWGNMSNGWLEVSRTVGADGVGVSEVQAFSVDYETTNRESIQFFIRHWRDTKKGGYKLTDERDIYELCANQAQRRKRACILAQIPGDITEMAMEQASVTLKTSADTSAEAMQKMVTAFASLGVTREQIEKRIQRRLDAIQPAQVVGLKRIYASLRDEVSAASDWFEIEQSEPPGGQSAADKAKVAIKARQTAAQKPAATVVDPDTGEIALSPEPKPEVRATTSTLPPAAAAQPQMLSRSYAVLASELQTAKTADDRALLIDEARALPAQQHAELVALAKRLDGGQ